MMMTFLTSLWWTTTTASLSLYGILGTCVLAWWLSRQFKSEIISSTTFISPPSSPRRQWYSTDTPECIETLTTDLLSPRLSSHPSPHHADVTKDDDESIALHHLQQVRYI